MLSHDPFAANAAVASLPPPSSPGAVIWDASLSLSLFLPRALGLSSSGGRLRIHQLFILNGHEEALNVKRYDFSFLLSVSYVSYVHFSVLAGPTTPLAALAWGHSAAAPLLSIRRLSRSDRLPP